MVLRSSFFNGPARRVRTAIFVVIPRKAYRFGVELLGRFDYLVFQFVWQAKINRLYVKKSVNRENNLADLQVANYWEFLTIARDDFSDLYHPYLYLFEKFVPVECRHNIITNAPNNAVPEALISRRSFKLNILEFLLNKSTKDYITLMHLDYFMVGPIDLIAISRAIEVMEKDSEIDFVQISRDIGEVISEKVYDENFSYLDSNSDSFFSMQARIWRKESLFALISGCHFCAIDHEVARSKVSSSLGQTGLIFSRFRHPFSTDKCANNDIFPHIATALNASKWRRQWRKCLNPLFIKFGIDPSKRGWI